jgi:hypothetical protein
MAALKPRDSMTETLRSIAGYMLVRGDCLPEEVQRHLSLHDIAISLETTTRRIRELRDYGYDVSWSHPAKGVTAYRVELNF